MNIENVLDIIDSHGTAINTLLSLITIAVSLAAVIVTYRISKRERRDSERNLRVQCEHYEESLKNQRRQFEEEKARYEEVSRNKERPYLVFDAGCFSVDRVDIFRVIKLGFLNKGQDTAYEIEPDLTCEDESTEPSYIKRCAPIQDPVLRVGERLTTEWKLIGENKMGYQFKVQIKYKDASGRSYKQIFVLSISNKLDSIYLINYPTPTLTD